MIGRLPLIAGAGLVALTASAIAGDPARDAILEAYAQQARGESPAFDGFSAVRGEQLYRDPHNGGNPQTPACAACHTADPRAPGRPCQDRAHDRAHGRLRQSTPVHRCG